MLPTWIYSDVVFPLPCLIVTFGSLASPNLPTPKMNSWNPWKSWRFVSNQRIFPGFNGAVFFCWSSSCSFISRVYFEPMYYPKSTPTSKFFFGQGIRTPNSGPFQRTISWNSPKFFMIHFWGTKITSESPQNPPKSPQNHLQRTRLAGH